MENNTQILITKEKRNQLLKKHLELLTSYLNQHTNWRVKQKDKVISLYHYYITHENIEFYYSRHIKIFLVALITGKLETIKNYFPKIYEDEI